MIRVKFRASETTNSIIFTASGHSGYTSAGNDIVCSAATMLAYTIANNVVKMEKRHFFKARPRILLNGGAILISCVPKSRHYYKVQNMFRNIEAGYELLEENHKKNVTLTTFADSESC